MSNRIGYFEGRAIPMDKDCVSSFVTVTVDFVAEPFFAMFDFDDPS
jgi:hypothetical protein